MDKRGDTVYINIEEKQQLEKVDLPQHGTVALIVQDSKVVRTETTTEEQGNHANTPQYGTMTVDIQDGKVMQTKTTVKKKIQ